MSCLLFTVKRFLLIVVVVCWDCHLDWGAFLLVFGEKMCVLAFDLFTVRFIVELVCYV